MVSWVGQPLRVDKSVIREVDSLSECLGFYVLEAWYDGILYDAGITELSSDSSVCSYHPKMM